MDSLSSVECMLEMFEDYYKNYCSWLWPSLDLTKGGDYNTYLDDRTGLAYCWFICGAFQYRRENENGYGNRF